MYRRQNFLQRMFSFAGTKEKAEFWSDLGISVISFLCVSVLMCIGVSILIPGDVAQLSQITETVVLVLGLVWSVSILAMTRRRLRDAGHSAKCYLWLLLPIAGWIVFIVCLCGNSK